MRTQTRNWSNDLEGRIVFLDKYTAEDSIEFQDIEFDVLDGYYFDEGFCTQIKSQVEVIFNRRLEAKKMATQAWQIRTNFYPIVVTVS